MDTTEWLRKPHHECGLRSHPAVSIHNAYRMENPLCGGILCQQFAVDLLRVRLQCVAYGQSDLVPKFDGTSLE